MLQDKIVAVAKFLRGKLAKTPAHKQPLHTQVPADLSTILPASYPPKPPAECRMELLAATWHVFTVQST